MAFFDPTAGQGTAEFMAFVFVMAPAVHPEACLTEGMTILAQREVFREYVRVPTSLIEVDQGIDIPVLKQTIGGEIVVGVMPNSCAPKASIAYRKLMLSCRLAPVKFIRMGSSVFKSEFRQQSIYRAHP